MGCGIGKFAKITVAGSISSTVYLDKEGGFNSAKCPWQLRGTLQCTVSHLGIAALPRPFACSTTLSGWNPQVAMLMGCLELKEKKEKTIQVKPRPTASIKTALQRVDKAS